MQKKLIVLAIASLASASAFAADTTVYGNLDAGIVNLSGTGQTGGVLAVSGGLSPSRLGVKASEDLEGGMKAIAVLEFSIDSETSAGLTSGASAVTTTTTKATGTGTPATATYTSTSATSVAGNARQELVGLAGDFGTVATGYLQTVAYDWSKQYDPLAGSSISSLQNVTGGTFLLGQKGGAVRAQRALAYISPDLGGLSFAVNYSTALQTATSLTSTGDVTNPSTTANANITATLVGVNYAAGPLNVGLAYAALGGASNATEFGVGVSYDITAAKLFLSYQSDATTSVNGATSTTNTGTSLSAVVPVGADSVVVQYAMNTINADSTLSATGYTLGYLHPMSKTTTAYAAYSGVTNGSAVASYGVDNGLEKGIGGGSTSSIIALGINKKF